MIKGLIQQKDKIILMCMHLIGEFQNTQSKHFGMKFGNFFLFLSFFDSFL